MELPFGNPQLDQLSHQTLTRTSTNLKCEFYLNSLGPDVGKLNEDSQHRS